MALAALLSLGVLSTVVYVATGWLGERLGPHAGHVVAVALLFPPYLAAVWLATRRAAASRAVLAAVLGFGLLFRLLQLATPVYLSSDLYRYLWDGRVQLAGISPYRYPPAAPELAELRDGDVHPRINRPTARTIYPPGAQGLFAATAALAPDSVLGWRLVLLVMEAATVLLLLRLLRGVGVPPAAVVVYAWAPLVVFEGVQAGHVDVAVVPLVLLALGLRSAGAPVAAGIALGLAVLVKLYPVVLMPAWWRRSDWRFPVAVAATVALGYLPHALTVGTGALGFLPEYFGSSEDFNVGLRAVVTWSLGFGGEAARAAVMAAFFAALAAAVVWIGRRRSPDAPGLWRAGAAAVGAYLLLVPTSMHPWYVLWLVPFLAVVPAPAWLYFSGGVTLSYLKYAVEPLPFPWWVWLAEYGPLYGLLLLAATGPLAARPPSALPARTA